MKLLLLLLVSWQSLALTPPPIGTYVFTENFELTGCAEFGDTRGPVAHCKRLETKKFVPKDEIKVDEFFWDDKTKTFGAKYVHLGTFRSVPMKVLKLKK